MRRWSLDELTPRGREVPGWSSVVMLRLNPDGRTLSERLETLARALALVNEVAAETAVMR